jgi:hypothetical protein
MVFINLDRVKKGLSVGEESTFHPLFERCKRIEVKPSANLFESMAARAIPVKCDQHQVQDKDGNWVTVFQSMPLSAGHGEMINIPIVENVKDHIVHGKELKSKSGTIRENIQFAAGTRRDKGML